MIPTFIKGAFLKSAVSHLQDGDTGSTLLGVLAAAILGAGIDFGKVSQGFGTTDSAMECGKVAGVAVITVWGFFIGKKKA